MLFSKDVKIDELGRIILSDEDLIELESSGAIIFAGAGDGDGDMDWEAINSYCLNTACGEQSINYNCKNKSCIGSSNVACG